MPTTTSTVIRGARTHNLRGINCEIPLQKVTVITGVSGSGKSTLAFDVLYAEGQRRFVECLSAYSRQFLERLERPRVDHIGTIQPPIALKQRIQIRNARSTVGSITELSDLIRLLMVHSADVKCRQCGEPVVRMEVADALKAALAYAEGTRLALVAPLAEVLDHDRARRLLQDGYTRVLVGSEVRDIEDVLAEAGAEHPGAGLVVDRVIVGRTRPRRLSESIQSCWHAGSGICRLQPLESGATSTVLRRGMACTACGTAAEAPSVGLFSWNSPMGACPECQGFGRIITIDRDKVVPDGRKNLRNNAVVPFSVPSARGWYRRLLKAAREREIPTDVAFRDLSPQQQDWVFVGDDRFPGVEGFFAKLEAKRYKMHVRIFISRFRGYMPCPACHGSRLRPEALAFTLAGQDIHALHEMPIEKLSAFFRGLDAAAMGSVLEEVRARIGYLENVGVGYLTLGRAGRTLSGGETQRIRLAAALGTALTDTLYILDEPTVGLHATDTKQMLRVLKHLAARGNTVVVVEHDPGIIEGADHLIVLGPGGGREGGRLTYEGPVNQFMEEEPGFFLADATSLTHPTAGWRERRRLGGASRRGRRARRLANPWDVDAVRRWTEQHRPGAAPRRSGPGLEMKELRAHNLKIPHLVLPLSGLVVISGVSGSGKSTLLDEVIHRNWLRSKGRPVEDVGETGSIQGWGAFEEIHLVGQQLLGRSSRSNPISFVQAYAEIRKLLAASISARQRKLAAGAFSFNTAGGRCESCGGLGTQVLEMYFMPDVEVPCEACGGKRFRPEVLEVTWRTKNIDDILAMTVDEATTFFRSEPAVVDRLAPLRDVGLGYITLGQSTATLSGGEAQRLRLAAYLAKGGGDERHLFLFDEPTTGLHARDVERLLRALRALMGRGHAVVVVEHHLDLIRAADWVVDLGPGPGEAGGRVVYAGPVDGLIETEASLTGRALRDHLSTARQG